MLGQPSLPAQLCPQGRSGPSARHTGVSTTLPSTGAWGHGPINPLHLLLLHLDSVTRGCYSSPACGGGGRGEGGAHLPGGAALGRPPHNQVLEGRLWGWAPGQEDAGGGHLGQDQPGGSGRGVQGRCSCGRKRSPGPGGGWCQWLCLHPLAATSRKDRGSPVVLRALRARWEGTWWGCTWCGDPAPVPAPSLTWAPTRAPALDLLADEPAEQAGERAELGEVLHVVDSDVQRLGGQEPQLGFVGILHACRGKGLAHLAPLFVV